MTTNQIFTLLHKRLTGNATEAERRSLDGNSTEATDRELRELWQRAGAYEPTGGPDTERAWARLQQRMQTDASRSAAPALRVRSRRVFVRYAAAAAAVLLVAAGAFYALRPAVQWQTGPGEQLAVALPDGSTVRLNGASTLRLADDFGTAGRHVILEGEGYFEVAKDADGKTFSVEGDGSVVTVLGTAFNFRSYPNEKMCDVEVTEGKVRFACEEADVDLLLTAGKRARITGRSTVLNVDGTPQNASAWRRGYLRFDDTPLAVALVDLSHFYGITFDVDPLDLKGCPLSGRFAAEDRAGLTEVLQRALPLELDELGPDRYAVRGSCAD